jgi:hypothetical protein
MPPTKGGKHGKKRLQNYRSGRYQHRVLDRRPFRHRSTGLTTTVIEGADVVAVDTEIIGSS